MEELREAIRDKRVLLFVGAGVSMSLGIPCWDSLMGHLAEELGFDKKEFKAMGDYLTLAEYYKAQKGSIGALRSWMDRCWHNEDIQIEQSNIHKYIVELGAPLIYTTNYDRWLETAYDYYGKEYVKISSVSDIPKINSSVTQIIKFHGDFDDDNSIVLTESSYFERLGFESPLDIKLRADVLAKSILFIGYSLTDLNVRYLLYKLNMLWKSVEVQEQRPKSYIFLAKPNPVQEEILKTRGIEPIVSQHLDLTKGLEEFLKELVSSQDEETKKESRLLTGDEMQSDSLEYSDGEGSHLFPSSEHI